MTRQALLLTGKPGTGKTALIKEALARTTVEAGGFYTEEIRTAGERQGFRIVTLDGQEAILAHVNMSSPYRVSKYAVDIGSLDAVGVSALQRALKQSKVVVIDEIGKMELFSNQFRKAVVQAIESGKKVLGTIMLNPHPFADQIKLHPEVEVIELTRDNRAQAMAKVLAWLREGDSSLHLLDRGTPPATGHQRPQSLSCASGQESVITSSALETA